MEKLPRCEGLIFVFVCVHFFHIVFKIKGIIHNELLKFYRDDMNNKTCEAIKEHRNIEHRKAKLNGLFLDCT